ncbi:MAG: hypothetical protein JNM85_00105 [Chthonomonas sp.]|nr:hypothetical protein [Chthonomonas sp.]
MIKKLWPLFLFAAASVLAGCGEKTDTDIDSVNKGKGTQERVEPRNREEGRSADGAR